MLKPASEAIAYRAYFEAESVGWDLTITECAQRLDVSEARLRQIVYRKKWTTRFRTMKTDQGLNSLINMRDVEH